MNKNPKITYEVEDSVAILTINRPERKNALDGETLEMLNTAMDLAEEALNIKAIIKPNNKLPLSPKNIFGS